MDLKEQILVALGLNKNEEVTLGWQGKSEDGTIFVSTSEELKEGADISVLTEDGTTILLPVGTYKVDTGVTFKVEAEGVVSEVTGSEKEEEDEVEKEEMTEETELEKKKDEEEEEDEKMKKRKKDNYMEEMPDWYKETYEEMKDKVDNLMDAIADLKSKMGVKEEDVKMEEENKTDLASEKVEEKEEDEVTKLKAENEKLKTELAETPAESPINTNKFSVDKKPLSRKEYNKLTRQERFLYNLNK
tara:strand:+ start:6778 stop:7512 length:735 start_codon:yes stop_codon:yes gene_type:complete